MKIPKLVKWEPIELRWIDSMHDAGWKHETEHDADSIESDLEHLTVGYFFMSTPRTISVVQSRTDWEHQKHNVDAVMCIPKVALLSIKRLA